MTAESIAINDTRPSRVCVFGFERFGSWPFNPSERLVRDLDPASLQPRATLLPRVLPTIYEAAGRIVQETIAQESPDLVVALGLSGKRSRICLERFALNIDDVAVADNAKTIREGLPIDADGPAALRTNIELSPLLHRLHAMGLDAEISNHAGTYVCNHVYFQALRAQAMTGRQGQALFIHLPMTADGLPGLAEGMPRWELTQLCNGVNAVLEQLVHSLTTPPSAAL